GDDPPPLAELRCRARPDHDRLARERVVKGMSASPSVRPDAPSESLNPRPLIGITMGDPAGIGAEVIVKALADPEIRKLGRFIIYGLNEILGYAADLAEINPFWFRLPHETVPK